MSIIEVSLTWFPLTLLRGAARQVTLGEPAPSDESGDETGRDAHGEGVAEVVAERVHEAGH